MVKVRPDIPDPPACPADIARSSLSEIPVMATERYNPRAAEPRWQKAWDAGKALRDEERRSAPEILRARDVPLSVGAHPHGPCPQLHDGRRGGAPSPRARLQRAAPDGLGRLRPAGRERRARPRRQPALLDLPEHRGDEGASSRSWACRSTGRARSRPATRYYKHQQKMFLDFWKAGLAERKSAKVNWDPEDMTVLANEQVIDGRGWRSGALVEQRDLTQWFFKITSMSQELLDSLETLAQVAGEGQADAGELDRPLRGPADPLGDRRSVGRRRERARSLHHPSRHDLRRVLHGDRRRPSAGEEGRARAIPSSPPSSTRSATAAPRPPRSRPPRRRVSTPASASSIRSTRTGRCRSMSRTSC